MACRPRRILVANFARYDTPAKPAADARLAPVVREELRRARAEELTARLRASDESVRLEHLVPPTPQH